MVRFIDKPYMSGNVGPKLSTLKWKMAVGIGITGIYFVTLADNNADLFDIYPAAVFKQKRMRRSDRVIIGIADSNRSANTLIESMIKDCLAKSGDLSDVRSFFEEYIKEHL